jgi:hypothetical protein
MTKDTNGNGPELIVLGRDDNGKPLAATEGSPELRAFSSSRHRGRWSLRNKRVNS